MTLSKPVKNAHDPLLRGFASRLTVAEYPSFSRPLDEWRNFVEIYENYFLCAVSFCFIP